MAQTAGPTTARTARVRLFGVPELECGPTCGQTLRFAPERRFQLLAVLALRSGEWVPRDVVATLLWPERGHTEALRNLRKVLFNARQVGGTAEVESTEHALRWAVATDLQDFERALAEHRPADAVALRRGPLLGGIDDPANNSFAEWLETERMRWDQAWREAAIVDLRQRTDPAARLAAARTLLAADTLDEVAVAALVDAQHALGDADGARQSYHAYAARLAAELGVEPARALRDRLPSTAPASRAPAPPADDSFIGRRTELAELRALLARPDCRLVTLLGPGGIGKSSLARHAIDSGVTGPRSHTHWVELQDLYDVAAVLARLAGHFGIEINDAADPVAPLARKLAGAATLLVLDNAEHLKELPAVIDRLLDACPTLCLLLTSRSRLHSRHEWLLPLAGLAVPEADSRDLEAAASFDAVRLFVARAAAAQRGFALTPHLAAVIAITEAVAGMPLAIELAASWVRLLPPQAIANELRGSIDVLERDPALRGEPARPEHRSMRAALDRSWQLLGPREREALAALSVFDGGFTRSTAQRVTRVPLALLSSLADASLLAADAGGRFGMHPLVAAYSRERLGEDAERALELSRRHAEHFARHLAALARHANGDQRLLAAGIDAEFANCCAAWSWAGVQQRPDLVYEMVRALWSYFENRGRLREGIELLTPALALAEQGAAWPRAQTRLCHGLSLLHHRLNDSEAALRLAHAGLAVGEHCGDVEAYVGCLLNIGTVHWQDGRPQEGRDWFERGLAVARQRADRRCTGWALGNLGKACTSLGDYARADECLTQALATSRALGDHYHVGLHLINLGALLCIRQDRPAALRCLTEGLHHCTAYRNPVLLACLHVNLGHVHRELDEPARAEESYRKALEMAREIALCGVEWSAEIGLARIETAAGETASAWARLARVVRDASQHSAEVEVAEAVVSIGDLHAARGDAAAAARAWRAGSASGALYASHRRAVDRRLAALPAALRGDGGPSTQPSLAEFVQSLMAAPAGPETPSAPRPAPPRNA